MKHDEATKMLDAFELAVRRDATLSEGGGDWPEKRAAIFAALLAPATPTPPEWQTIDSAPKDGRRLVVHDGDGEHYIVWWTDDAYAENGGKGGPEGWYGETSGGDCVWLRTPKFWFDPITIAAIAHAPLPEVEAQSNG